MQPKPRQSLSANFQQLPASCTATPQAPMHVHLRAAPLVVHSRALASSHSTRAWGAAGFAAHDVELWLAAPATQIVNIAVKGASILPIGVNINPAVILVNPQGAAIWVSPSLLPSVRVLLGWTPASATLHAHTACTSCSSISQQSSQRATLALHGMRGIRVWGSQARSLTGRVCLNPAAARRQHPANPHCRCAHRAARGRRGSAGGALWHCSHRQVSAPRAASGRRRRLAAMLSVLRRGAFSYPFSWSACVLCHWELSR